MNKPNENFIKLISEHKKILIIGYPGSGKTELTKVLKTRSEFKGYIFVELDDYEPFGYKDSLYAAMGDVEEFHKDARWIVEGVIGYRYLRKIEQLRMQKIKPDCIITCLTKRPLKPKHVTMVKGLRKIWNEYVQIRTHVPTQLEYEN